MSQYQVTIQIDSDTRIDRLRDTLDRIVQHTFGSSGEVVNFVEVDTDADPDEWETPAPNINTGWERMTRYRGKSGVRYQSKSDAAYAFDLEED